MVLNNEIRERQIERIKSVLKRGLNKKVLISNTTFDEHDDRIGEILEGNLSYDVNILANTLYGLVEMCGITAKVANGVRVNSRNICLGSEVESRNIDVQGDEKRDVTYYNYLIYPEVVESFLNDLENLDNEQELMDCNSILVGFDDDRKYVDYIDFSNCYNIDCADLNNSSLLKYIFGLVRVVNVKKYVGEDTNLNERISYNDFVLGFLRRITNTNEINILNNTYKKGKVKKKKLNE